MRGFFTDRLRTFFIGTLRIQREIQLQDVDTRFAEEAELPPGGVARDQPPDVASEIPRSRATRGTWNSAAAGEMCGSNPDADVVTRSIGTGHARILLPRRLDVRLDGVDQLLVRRPELAAAELAAS